jgi:hypothetical protein
VYRARYAATFVGRTAETAHFAAQFLGELGALGAYLLKSSRVELSFSSCAAV